MVKSSETEGRYHNGFPYENFNNIDFLKEQKLLLNNTYLFLDYENINQLDYCENNNNVVDKCLFLIDNRKVKDIVDFSHELNKRVYGNNFSKKGYDMFFDKNVNNFNTHSFSDNFIYKNINSTSSNDIENLSVLFSMFIRKLVAFLYIFNTFIKNEKLKFFIENVIKNIFSENKFYDNENYTNLNDDYLSDYKFIASKIKDYYVFVPNININKNVYRIYFDKFYFQKDEVVKTFFMYMKRFLDWDGNIIYIDVKNSLFKFMFDFDINRVANVFSVFSEKSKNDNNLYKEVVKMFFDIRDLFTRKKKDVNKENGNVENRFIGKKKTINNDYFDLAKKLNNNFTKELEKQLENHVNGLPFSDVDLFNILSKEFQVDRNELKHEFIVFVNKFISKLQKDINSRNTFLNTNGVGSSLSELEIMFEDFVNEMLFSNNFKHIDVYYNLIKDKLFYYFTLSRENNDIQRKFYYDYAKYLWNYQKTLLEKFEIKNFKLLYINFDGLILLEL